MQEDKDQILRRVQELEDDNLNLTNTLNNFFIKGRLRTDRGTPSASNDVGNADKLYDVVITATYVYFLIDASGSLSWRRVAVASF